MPEIYIHGCLEHSCLITSGAPLSVILEALLLRQLESSTTFAFLAIELEDAAALALSTCNLDTTGSVAAPATELYEATTSTAEAGIRNRGLSGGCEGPG